MALSERPGKYICYKALLDTVFSTAGVLIASDCLKASQHSSGG